MATFDRIEHSGSAVATTIVSDITSGATTLVLTDATGWPTGSVGKFYATIDAGTATEEKVLITARSGTGVSGMTRGVDGTSASAHSGGASIVHGFVAVEADEANQISNMTAGAVTTKGDLLVATGSKTLARLAAAANSTLLQYDSAQATGVKGALLASANIAAGAVNAAAIGSGAVTLTKFGTGLRPEFIVADSTALLALSASAGDIAYQLDVDHLFAYDGAAWSPAATITQQTAVTGGPTSGTTELTIATLSIAALPARYELECSAFWSAYNSVDGDMFKFRIKVSGERAAISQRHVGGANIRLPYSLPTSTFTTIAASAAATVTVTVQRTLGTGTLTEETAGLVTAKMRFV